MHDPAQNVFRSGLRTALDEYRHALENGDASPYPFIACFSGEYHDIALAELTDAMFEYKGKRDEAERLREERDRRRRLYEDELRLKSVETLYLLVKLALALPLSSRND